MGSWRGVGISNRCRTVQTVITIGCVYTTCIVRVGNEAARVVVSFARPRTVTGDRVTQVVSGISCLLRLPLANQACERIVHEIAMLCVLGDVNYLIEDVVLVRRGLIRRTRGSQSGRSWLIEANETTESIDLLPPHLARLIGYGRVSASKTTGDGSEISVVVIPAWHVNLAHASEMIECRGNPE